MRFQLWAKRCERLDRQAEVCLGACLDQAKPAQQSVTASVLVCPSGWVLVTIALALIVSYVLHVLHHPSP